MTAPDPVRARRAQIARWTALANRLGYVVLGLGIVLFLTAFAFGFPATLATLVVVALVVSSALLVPSIILGYAVRAAERDDQQHGH